jgi:TonB family protein
MKTITAPTPYGYQELRLFHQRYMMLAMLVAITFQMTVIGGYHFTEWLKPPEDNVGPVIKWRPNEIPLPPSIKGPSELPVATLLAKMANAYPKPVDIDPEDDTAKTITPQNILSQQTDPNTQLIAEGKVKIEIIEPPDEQIVDYPDIPIPPVAIATPIPEYPELAQKINLEGSVTVVVTLNREGRVKEAKLLKVSEEIFAQPALDAAKKWVFTPAIMNGHPVQVRVAIPFKFKLKH